MNEVVDRMRVLAIALEPHESTGRKQLSVGLVDWTEA